MDFSGFPAIPVIDSHVHFVHPERLGEMLDLFALTRTSRANLVCIPNPGAILQNLAASKLVDAVPEPDTTTHNPAALFFKQRYPAKVFISGALDYVPALANPAHAPHFLAEQVISLKSAGFDGLKLIEGKPQARKLLPYPLDGPFFAEVWAALEAEEFPVVFHVADPDEFWDPAGCPDWARQQGWDYTDGSYPSKEELYAEVENVLARHPRLKITLAHFYFLSHDLARAARFLDEHPGVCFDLAPHMEMYTHFSRDAAAARAFFLRYADRILYGTDLDTRALARGASGLMRFIPWLIRSTLERNGPFRTPDGDHYQGLGLPAAALEKIYYKNFERIYGSRPAVLKEEA